MSIRLISRLVAPAVLGLGVAAGAVSGGTFAVNICGTNQAFVVRNTSGEAITPRVIVRGWADASGHPPRHAAGLRLDGKRLCGRLLNGATWILEPDGTAKWSYRTGFYDWIEDPPSEPHQKYVHYENVWWDHWPPRIPSARAYQYTLTLASGGHARPNGWTCRVAFPDGVTVREFRIQASPTGHRDLFTPVTQLFGDPACRQLVDEVSGLAFPHVYTNVPSTFWVRFTSSAGPEKAPPRAWLALYRVWMSAELDAAAVPRPVLPPGESVLRVEDDADSSHRWRIVLQHDALPDDPETALHARSLPIPERVTAHRSRFRDTPRRTGKTVPLREFFPLGMYTGGSTLARDKALDFIVDDVVDHNGNMIYTSNNNITLLTNQLDLCERAGLKLIHQGGSAGSLYYLNYRYAFLKGSVEREVQHNVTGFQRSIAQYMPGVRGRWGLLAWSPAEEQPPDTPARIMTVAKMLREADPEHPIHLLHNNFETAKNDLALGLSEAITVDRYAYSMGVGSTRTTRESAMRWLLGSLSEYRRACDVRDVPVWFMGQMVGGDPRDELERPPYGATGAFRRLRAPDIRVQGWLGIAAGCRGITFYAYQSNRAGVTHARDVYWRTTAKWEAAGRLFGEIEALTPLLLQLKAIDDLPDETVSVAGGKLITRVFGRRDIAADELPGRYAVVVNWDHREAVTAHVSGKQTVGAEVMWDVKRDRAVTPAKPLGLHPGEGTVVWLGARTQVEADRAFVEATQQRWKAEYGLEPMTSARSRR